MSTKQKKFIYCKARFNPERSPVTMQELLDSTFKDTKVADRQFRTSDDAPHYKFLNQISTMRGFFSANLYAYEEGQMAQIIKAHFDEDYIKTEALQPGTADDGTAQHFLGGKLYFSCFQDHLIIAQDQAVRTVDLERYLQNMISERTPGLLNGRSFTLERSIPMTTVRKIERVKKLEIGAMLPGDRNRKNGEHTKELTSRMGMGRIASVLGELFGADVNLKDFPMRGIIEDNEVRVKVSLRWEKPNRSETTIDQLDSIANTFRHVDDELDLKIFAGSGQYTNSELRLEKMKAVKHIDDMPSFDDICHKMIDWYNELNAAKQI